MTTNNLAKGNVSIGSFSNYEEERLAYSASREAILEARASVARSANAAMVRAYWEIGKQINSVCTRYSGYGTSFMKNLASALTSEFGKGFTYANLCKMRQFNSVYPMFATVSRTLSWSHYVILIAVEDESARTYYQQEAEDGNLSVRSLRRMIQTRAYERLLHAPKEASGTENAECSHNPAVLQAVESKPIAETLKDPYVLEFLNLGRTSDYLEEELEQLLISKLQDFLLELGRGFAFVGRQVRVSDESNDYYIDLVFYNYLARCFVLIDLKTGKLDPRDVGQMDFYVRLFSDTHAIPGDNPPIGLLLCASKDDTVARYTALFDNPQLYAAQYLPYLPTEQELEAVLRQRLAEYGQCHMLEDAGDGADTAGAKGVEIDGFTTAKTGL